jgi:hypothetical protein
MCAILLDCTCLQRERTAREKLAYILHMVQDMSTVVYMSTESIKYCILAVDIDTVHDYCIAREYRIWVLHMFSTYVFTYV